MLSLMKNKHFVPIACIGALSNLLILSAVNAQTYSNACDASSHVVLPSGKCIDLEYLQILGDSRATRQQIERVYQRQFNANVKLETIYNQYPQFNDETKEEKDRRYKNLAETSIVRDEVAASNTKVEDVLFPLHVRAMATMRNTFAPYSYSSR